MRRRQAVRRRLPAGLGRGSWLVTITEKQPHALSSAAGGPSSVLTSSGGQRSPTSGRLFSHGQYLGSSDVSDLYADALGSKATSCPGPPSG